MIYETTEQDIQQDRFRELQLILQRKQNRDVSYFEAEEIGLELISLYETLAENNEDDEDKLV
jgi:hypothetical protein